MMLILSFLCKGFNKVTRETERHCVPHGVFSLGCTSLARLKSKIVSFPKYGEEEEGA